MQHHVHFTHSGYTARPQPGQHHPKPNYHIHLSCLELVCALFIICLMHFGDRNESSLDEGLEYHFPPPCVILKCFEIHKQS